MARDSSHQSLLLLRRALLALVSGALACAPDLPVPTQRAGAPPGSSDGGVRLEVEPPSPIEAAPPILRLRLFFDAEPPVDPARVYLIEGEIGPSHIRQIKRNALSKALSARIVPALVWLAPGDEAAEQVVVVAPTVPLELGGTFTIATGEPSFSAQIRVLKDDPARTLERVWPPLEGGVTGSLGIWCGDEAIAPFEVAAALEPGGPPGFLRAGAVNGAGMRCARFEAEPSSSVEIGMDAALVGPPAIELESGYLRLDPRPFVHEASPSPVEPLACDPDEVQLGPGCARVLDDRLIGRAPEAPLLWVVASPELGIDHVFATAGGDPFGIAPLAPLTSLGLGVTTLDIAGGAASVVVSVSTLAPMPHVIINEVYANPLGEEPEQEWIEIVNDGAVAADLAGYVVADIGGKSALPSVELPPGGFALIANEAYDELEDELDPAPPPGALIVRVPGLGRSGLSNGGEPIKLLDAAGIVLSRAPATPKPKAGWSVARVSPLAVDGLATSFKLSRPTPGSPNVTAHCEQ
jgi:hypothetical protein